MELQEGEGEGERGEEREGKGTEAIVEIIMTENFLKLITDAEPWIQKPQRRLNRVNTKISMGREGYHIWTAENQWQRENLERS